MAWSRRGAGVHKKNIDITGMRFGKLTAVSMESDRRHGSQVWRCICECGNSKLVIRKSLLAGGTRSCGCMIKGGRYKHGYDGGSRGINLTGCRFGKLTVVAFLEASQRGWLWECSCDCGNKIVASTGGLRSGSIAKCKNCPRHYGREVQRRKSQKCIQCGSVFFSSVSRKYCSWKCSGAAKTKSVVTSCAVCGREILRVPGKYNGSACSRKCQAKWQSGRPKQRRRSDENLTRTITLRELERQSTYYTQVIRKQRSRLWSVVIEKRLNDAVDRGERRRIYYADPWATKFKTWSSWSKRRPRPFPKNKRTAPADINWDRAMWIAIRALLLRKRYRLADSWEKKIGNKLSNLRKRRRMKNGAEAEYAARRCIDFRSDGEVKSTGVQVRTQWDSVAS